MMSEGSRLWAGAWLAGRCVCCLFVWGGYIHLSWAVSTFGLWLGVGRSSIDRSIDRSMGASSSCVDREGHVIDPNSSMDGAARLDFDQGCGRWIIHCDGVQPSHTIRPPPGGCCLPAAARCWGCCGRVNQNRPPRSKSASPVRVVCNDVHLVPPWPPRVIATRAALLGERFRHPQPACPKQGADGRYQKHDRSRSWRRRRGRPGRSIDSEFMKSRRGWLPRGHRGDRCAQPSN